MKKTITCLLATTALAAFAGCQQNTASTQKTTAYTAPHYMRTGSNVPQRDTGGGASGYYIPPNESSSISTSGNGSAGGLGTGAR